MKSVKFVLLLALVVSLFIFPVFPNIQYWIDLLTNWWITLLLTISFWLILTTGQVNLAHAGFAAIGGYVSAALITTCGWNSWAALPVGIISAGVIALALGYITLRITGIYFIIMTVTLSVAINVIFGLGTFFGHKSPFGGLSGLASLPAPNRLFSISFTSFSSLYYLSLVFMLLVVFLVYRIYYSSTGRVFRGINSSDRLAEHVGINIMNYKVLAFVIGSMCASLGGILWTYYTTAISPTSFTLTQSTYYIVFCAVGGLPYFAGPIVGTVVLSYITYVIRANVTFQNIIYSVLLIIAILAFKNGLLGQYLKIQNWLLRLILKNKTIVKSV